MAPTNLEQMDTDGVTDLVIPADGGDPTKTIATAVSLLAETSSNEEQLLGLILLAKESAEVKNIMDDHKRKKDRENLQKALHPDFFDTLFLSEMPTNNAKRLAVQILYITQIKCSSSILEAYTESLLADQIYDEAEEVLTLLNSWNISLTNEGLVERLCDPQIPFQREDIRFSTVYISTIQKHLLKEENKEHKKLRAWLGRTLADILEEIGPMPKDYSGRKPLLEALPTLLGDIPTRGAALAICTMLARHLEILTKDDLGIKVLMAGLRFAHVEIQMHLETTTAERERDLCAFMSGCLFTEATITNLDETLEISINTIGNIISALHRILVVAFDFWIQEKDISKIPKDEVGIPLARLISAWTNGDPEKFSTEFNQIVPKIMAVAPEASIPAIDAVHQRDSAPAWCTEKSLEILLNFVLTDGASFPRQVALRILAEISMDPYLDLHTLIPQRPKIIFDKRGQVDAAIPRPLPCRDFRCSKCYIINSWAKAMDEQMKKCEEDDDLSLAFEVAIFCFRANCGNQDDLPELDLDVWAPRTIDDELGYLFRMAVRAMAIIGRGALFKIPRKDEDWIQSDQDAAEIIIGRGPGEKRRVKAEQQKREEEEEIQELSGNKENRAPREDKAKAHKLLNERDQIEKDLIASLAMMD